VAGDDGEAKSMSNLGRLGTESGTIVLMAVQLQNDESA